MVKWVRRSLGQDLCAAHVIDTSLLKHKVGHTALLLVNTEYYCKYQKSDNAAVTTKTNKEHLSSICMSLWCHYITKIIYQLGLKCYFKSVIY